ncbi:MAG TPA: futalosine hydrolase [Nitrospirota bacterium]|nr:futalosine hydrolase [Nitrospirota bacterium]
MIALLCSVQAEAELLLETILHEKTISIGSKTMIEGSIQSRRVCLCVGGMGKVNAAHAATLLVQRNPEALVVFGIGGAYPASGARVGDVAVANTEIAGDEGVLTLEGFKDTEYIGIPLLKTSSSVIFTTYPAPAALLHVALQTLLSDRRDMPDVHVGAFVTLSTCTGTESRARELEDRYHGLCENMEGAAAAQVAELHSLPWLEVRGISNLVENRDVRKWDIPAAARAAQQAVLRILEGWSA